MTEDNVLSETRKVIAALNDVTTDLTAEHRSTLTKVRRLVEEIELNWSIVKEVEDNLVGPQDYYDIDYCISYPIVLQYTGCEETLTFSRCLPTQSTGPRTDRECENDFLMLQ